MSCNVSLRALRIGLRIRTLPSTASSPVNTECTWLHHLLSTVTSKQLSLVKLGIHLRGLREGAPTDTSLLFATLAAFFSGSMCAALDALLCKKRFHVIETVRASVMCDHDGLKVDEQHWGVLLAERFPLLAENGILR